LILIAEDNETNQKVILQQLMLLGHTADIANNGREALARWKSGDYAILFADLHMPEMDGYELTAAIRAQEKDQAHLPIIAFTANALKGEAERCKAIGMDDYLSKPVQLVTLKAMLAKWLPVMTSIPIPAVRGLSANAPMLAPHLGKSVAVDVNVLKALIGNEESLIRVFLGDFRHSAEVIASDLRVACAGGEAKAAAASAHKLKSAARSVGALDLGELCVTIERIGNVGDVESLLRMLPRFEQEFARVDDFLARY
jgi:CheY-like chemotaxis protein/HPt (histidine-containing phosphotransfer) domain-containing protein